MERYNSGAVLEVWDEIRHLGPRVRVAPALDESKAVARELMGRVRVNIEALAKRLPEIGYKFSNPARVHVPPSPTTAHTLDEVEKLTGGPMPLALRAFYEVVGSVDFTQSLDQLVQWHEDRRDQASEIETLGEHDPLYVQPIEELHADLLSAQNSSNGRGARWLVQRGDDPSRRWKLSLSPDECHKANYSGGANFRVALPDPSADFRILDLRPGPATGPDLEEYFVDYLRQSLSAGGFRGRPDPEAKATRIPPRTPLIAQLVGGLPVF